MSDHPPPAGDAADSRRHPTPRAVAWQRAFAWYTEALKLFRRAPLASAMLGAATILCAMAFELVPGAGPLLSEIITPLVACGLVYAAAACDRGETPRLVYAVAAFVAPAGAIAAIVGASLLTLAAEALAGFWIADVNLLGVDRANLLHAGDIMDIYAIGVFASLPVAFIPYHVLLAQQGPGAAFAASFRAFAMNALPLVIYAVVSLVLLGIGLLTMGLGLVIVLPLLVSSTYVAWKEIFGIDTRQA